MGQPRYSRRRAAEDIWTEGQLPGWKRSRILHVSTTRGCYISNLLLKVPLLKGERLNTNRLINNTCHLLPNLSPKLFYNFYFAVIAPVLIGPARFPNVLQVMAQTLLPALLIPRVFIPRRCANIYNRLGSLLCIYYGF